MTFNWRQKISNRRAKAYAYTDMGPAGIMTGNVALAAADMVLSQHVVSPDPMPAGGIATITITVDNNGPDAASNVKLTDAIPVGSTFVDMTASDGGTCTAVAPYTCTWATYPANAQRTVTVRVKLPNNQVYSNQVDLSSDTADSNTANNSLTRTITVVAAADLKVEAVHNAGAGAVAGTPYNYTLTVSNQGPNALPAGENPKVTFQIPAGATITGAPSGTGWTCSPSTGYPRSNPSYTTPITCSRNDTLASGSDYPAITIPAVGNTNGTVSAAFGVSSDFPDGDLTNNTQPLDVPFTSGTDMAINKSVSPSGIVVTGDQVTYTLTPRRLGGVNPSNVVVTDTLPAGLTYVSHSASTSWDCNFVSPTLTCTYLGEYTGAPHSNMPTIQMVATVGTGTIANVGTIALPPGQNDPVPGNNTSSTVTITGSNDADLRVTKAASLTPVVPGQTYNWNIVARNLGPAPIKAGQTITITENIPAGMSLVGNPGGWGWTCDQQGATVATPISGAVTITCTRSGPLARNTDAPTITVPVQHAAASTLTNQVCGAISGVGPSDPDNSNDCDTKTNTSSATSANLSITKSASPNSVIVGELLTYTLTVNNAGPNAATNVTVSDTLNNLLHRTGLPGLDSVTFSSPDNTATGCSPTTASSGSPTVSCNLGTLNNGQSATVTIKVRPDNTGSTVLSRGNIATVTSPEIGDPDRSDNSTTINSDVEPRVDVTVNKSVTPNPVRVGQPMVYTITAENKGPSAAANVKITDILPPNTAMLGTATASNSGTCTAPASGTEADGTEKVECTWASIPRNTQYTATFELRPLPAALNTTINNTVNVTTTSTDTDSTNNRSQAATSVIDSLIDILVQKTDSVDPVPLGGETEYTIDITNVGPSVGTNLVMIDTFPAAGSTPSARFSYQGGLTLTGTGASAGTCSEPAIGAIDGVLQCTFPVFEVGAPNKITVKYKMRAESIVTAGDYAGTQRNHVVVSVDENETEQDNNEVNEDTTSRRAAIATDLALTKSVDKATLVPGDTLTYTLSVTNNGPLESVGAQVVDPLPAGLTFVSSADGCVEAAGTVTCAVGTLANGDSKEFTFVAQLDDPYTGSRPLVNTATIDAPGDTDPDNNSDDAGTNVPAPPAPVPVDNPLALLALILGMGWVARRFHMRKHA